MSTVDPNRDRTGRFAPMQAVEAPVSLTPVPGGEHFVIADGNRVDVIDGNVQAAIDAACAKPTGSQPDRGRTFRTYR